VCSGSCLRCKHQAPQFLGTPRLLGVPPSSPHTQYFASNPTSCMPVHTLHACAHPARLCTPCMPVHTLHACAHPACLCTSCMPVHTLHACAHPACLCTPCMPVHTLHACAQHNICPSTRQQPGCTSLARTRRTRLRATPAHGRTESACSCSVCLGAQYQPLRARPGCASCARVQTISLALGAAPPTAGKRLLRWMEVMTGILSGAWCCTASTRAISACAA